MGHEDGDVLAWLLLDGLWSPHVPFEKGDVHMLRTSPERGRMVPENSATLIYLPRQQPDLPDTAEASVS